MGRYYLKKSYISEGINLYLIRLILLILKKRFKARGKVLIKSCDGIGDILIRSRLSEKIIEKYGKDNVIFMLKSEYLQMGEILGYNCIGYSRNERKNFIHRLKKMWDLNNMGFSTYINIEFVNDLTVGNIFAPKRVGIEDMTLSNRRYNKYYTKSFKKIEGESVIEVIKDIGENILDEKFSIDEITPDLRYLYPQGDSGIVIAVGTSAREKTCSPARMNEYIRILLEKFPEENIYLVGSGKLHKRYAEDLMALVKDDRIIDMVDKTSLKEVFQLIAKSKLFVGFDSGLYNFAYTVRKPIIVLFKDKLNGFAHNAKWVEVLLPEKNMREEDIKVDKIYGNRAINSISREVFKRALENLRDII